MTRLFLVALVAGFPTGLAAQNSIYGTRGVGFPGRPESVRSVALGGGAVMFDRASAVNPALTVAFRAVTVGASTGSTFRNYSAAGTEASGLQETRFPLAFVAGGIGRSRFSYMVSMATFAERTFDITLNDTIMIDGSPVGVIDRLTSNGGIVDIRGAVGWRGSPVLTLGGAVHVLTGSSRVGATRIFDDPGFRTFSEDDALSSSGTGFSGGVFWVPHPKIQLAAVGRINSSLSRRLSAGASQKTEMPRSFGAGISLALASNLRWMTSARFRSWSRTGQGVAAAQTRAFDTWEAGSGIEMGGQLGGGGLPIRLGVRYAQLPFSPSDDQPTEWNFSAGTGTRFAGDRAMIDVAVERFQRDGVDARERGWYFAIGITVVPGR